MEKEKRMLLLHLSGLTPDNVSEIYTRNYNRWRYMNSDEVIVNGKKVEGLERELLLLPDKNGNPQIKTCTVSDTTEEGLPLTEEKFIDEELKWNEQRYEKSFGSKINRSNNIKLGIYLEYLRQRKENLNKDYSSLAKQLKENQFINGTTAEVLKSIIENHSLPESCGRVTWTGNRVSAWYFKEHFKIGRYSPEKEHYTPGIFNKCFEMKDKKALHVKDKPNNLIPDEPLRTILDGFK
jgi:hypothetical protein